MKTIDLERRRGRRGLRLWGLRRWLRRDVEDVKGVILSVSEEVVVWITGVEVYGHLNALRIFRLVL